MQNAREGLFHWPSCVIYKRLSRMVLSGMQLVGVYETDSVWSEENAALYDVLPGYVERCVEGGSSTSVRVNSAVLVYIRTGTPNHRISSLTRFEHSSL